MDLEKHSFRNFRKCIDTRVRKNENFSEKFAYIGATPFIFNTTLRNNVLYGNSKDINDSEIIDMLKIQLIQ